MPGSFIQLIKPLFHFIRYKIKAYFHKGNKYICPFCNYQAKDLEPLGLEFPVLKEKEIIGAGRRNSGCYCCGSQDRERLIYLYLKDYMRIFEKADKIKILHFSPEKELCRALRKGDFQLYLCGDLYTKGYSYPSYVKDMNVLDIPHEDNFFDLIICNHVLEHIPNDLDAMKEICRVLKKGGKAILQVPISKKFHTTFEDSNIKTPKQRELAFGQSDHVSFGQWKS